MVKSINNLSGKSARHQQHELKYALSHKMATLERWYKKITSPKTVNVLNIKISEEKLAKAAEAKKRRVGRDPVKVEAQRQRGIIRAKEYYQNNPHKWEMKQMVCNDININ